MDIFKYIDILMIPIQIFIRIFICIVFSAQIYANVGISSIQMSIQIFILNAFFIRMYSDIHLYLFIDICSYQNWYQCHTHIHNLAAESHWVWRFCTNKDNEEGYDNWPLIIWHLLPTVRENHKGSPNIDFRCENKSRRLDLFRRSNSIK